MGSRRCIRPVVERLAGRAAVPSKAFVHRLPDLARLVSGLRDDAVVAREGPDGRDGQVARQ